VCKITAGTWNENDKKSQEGSSIGAIVDGPDMDLKRTINQLTQQKVNTEDDDWIVEVLLKAKKEDDEMLNGEKQSRLIESPFPVTTYLNESWADL